ncbi:hypothetical protein QVD17_39133 [Tagetes erecta]|uniref:Serpin domain-containing protein n=1 Tax=Tagetes erecta TaxID=13708 RepID=A0AAD8JRR4_TARER|nr:hypothetical protein QVD17_39133 [Tagetes erecta]
MDLKQSINKQTQVSTTFATHLLSNHFPDSNVVFSPLSIHVVLSLLAAASKGPTLDQLHAFLQTKSTDDLNELSLHLVTLILADANPRGGPRLAFANGLWVEKTLSLKPSFTKVVDTFYKAACEQVDFRKKAVKVAKEVNLWAEKQTKGLIKQVIDPTNAVNNLTQLIFANALYFKGTWKEKFDISMTKQSYFHLLNGKRVQVPFMESNKDQYVRQYDEFKVLGLPYLQGEDERAFTMYFYLPNAKKGLQSLVRKISTTPSFFDTHIPKKKLEMRKFSIPKFKISFGFTACDVLKELGLVLPFSAEAGLSEMVDSSDGQNIYGSSIHHTAFVEVNEEGTKAAAVNIFHAMMLCEPEIKPKVDFVADHPFLFVIREDMCGAVLFVGQVIDPRGD